MEKYAVAILCALALTACPSDDDDGRSATELCNALADVQCERLYECLSADERADLGLTGTSSSCKAQMRIEYGCGAANDDDLCDGNERFFRADADRCVNQFRGASCSQVRDDENYAPACERICRVE